MTENKKRFKPLGVILFGLVAAGVIMGFAGSGMASEYVAVVNGVRIPKNVYDAEINLAMKRMLAQGKTINDSVLLDQKKIVLDDLVNRELLYQEAQKQKIVVPEVEIDRYLASVNRQFPTDADKEKAMGEIGITFDEYTAQIRKALVVNKLVETVWVPEVSVSPEDISEFYVKNKSRFKDSETIRASHILVKTPKDATPEDKAKAKKKIDGIKSKITGGEDFATLAKSNSDCPSGASGGDLGFFGKGQMVPAFETAAFALKKGEVSDVVETPFGYHIIRLEDKKPAKEKTLEESTPMIKKMLFRDAVSAKVTDELNQLKKNSNIELPASS